METTSQTGRTATRPAYGALRDGLLAFTGVAAMQFLLAHTGSPELAEAGSQAASQLVSALLDGLLGGFAMGAASGLRKARAERQERKRQNGDGW